ncbi:hypothetical protein NG99_04615 [Erwinia typographi]|uniref:Uncharacterized protein n=1 Tax=Erwinia typographi TaxID=371042 RepID=A0A0A3ZCC5_9GAMM|nr:hypothetical protein [Erwinia typographi]KGT95306.1 hypothetical protein NG99_04615 [Erwinia typographi]
MTATTTPRNTPWRDAILTPVGVAKGETIPEGAIVCINADGYAVNGKADATLKFGGCAAESVDNSTGADGDITILVRTNKAFRWDQDGTITQANLLDRAYVLDNQTVTATDGSTPASDDGKTPATEATNCKAGSIIMIDADGVWIY